MAGYEDLLNLLRGKKEEPNMSEDRPDLAMSTGDPADTEAIGEDVTEQKAKQDIVNKELNREVASANASDPSMKEPKKQSIQDLMKDYLSGREGYQQELKDARDTDRKLSAGVGLAQALAGLGQSHMQTKSGVPIQKTKFKTPKFDSSKDIKSDRAAKLQELLTAKKLQDMGQEGLSEYQKRALKLRERELGIKEKDLAKKREAKEKAPKESIFKKEKLKALGKGAAEFYQSTKPQLMANLPKIDSALDIMEKDKDLTGGLTSKVIGDTALKLRSEEAYKAQQNMQSAITDTLRPTLGAQFTEKEGERIMNLTFDPAVSTDENKKRAKALKKVIENKVKFSEDLYQHLEEHGSDEGFDYDAYGMKKAGESAAEDSVLLEAPNGQRKRVRKDQAQKYLDKGAKVVGN